MQAGRILLPLLLIAAGCARTAAPPAPSPAARTGDSALYQLLEKVPLDSAAEVALQNYELQDPWGYLEKVAEVAGDSAAGLGPRYNAVQILGERGAGMYVPALQAALADRDPRVRAAAVAAAGRILDKSDHTGLSVVLAGLEDRAPAVQGKALEVLGTRDIPLLRDFLARHPKGEAAVIAQGLLQAGEDRGAPLAGDSTGVLRRTTAGGMVLEFRPTARWPQWHAAVGTVTISAPTSPPVSITDVEVVADVVPVFFAADESAVVYEQGRRIYVRQFRNGDVREVGSGIAPRPLPFTEDFIYLRQDTLGGGDLREKSHVKYDVLRAGFRANPADPRFVGKLNATAEMKLFGNYSPARWLRVTGKETSFSLEGNGAETFKLPDPFKPGSGP